MTEPLKYIGFDDALEIMGLTSAYVRGLIRDGAIRAQGSRNKLFLVWEDVCKIAQTQRPPWSLLTNNFVDGTLSPDNLMLRVDDAIPDAQDFKVNRLMHGDCITIMRQMPSNFVQSVVTSPPYWGVRRYAGSQDVTWADGTTCAFGTEETVQDYVRHTMEIFRHLKRVLRDNGIIWWNMGDTYHTDAYIREGSSARLAAFEGRQSSQWKDNPNKRTAAGHPYLKDKDLTLVPFQVALGAQRLGFWVRSIIIWEKRNIMPESVRDRPATSHEYILMFVKAEKYKYDYAAAKEPRNSDARDNGDHHPTLRNLRTVWHPQHWDMQEHVDEALSDEEDRKDDLGSIPSIWTFPTTGLQQGTHSAAFPEELPERCITISSEPGDLVFDPFAGSGTTLVVAKRLSRRYLGCDLSTEYLEQAEQRIAMVTRQSGRVYPTDVTDTEWTAIQDLIEQQHDGSGRRRTLNLREIVNAARYYHMTNCRIDDLPLDFPHPKSVLRYYKNWEMNQVWQQLQERIAVLRQSENVHSKPIKGVVPEAHQNGTDVAALPMIQPNNVQQGELFEQSTANEQPTEVKSLSVPASSQTAKGSKPLPIILTERQCKALKELRRLRGQPLIVQRANIILSAAVGFNNGQIAQFMDLERATVQHWWNRWLNATEYLHTLERLNDQGVRDGLTQVLSDTLLDSNLSETSTDNTSRSEVSSLPLDRDDSREDGTGGRLSNVFPTHKQTDEEVGSVL